MEHAQLSGERRKGAWPLPPVSLGISHSGSNCHPSASEAGLQELGMQSRPGPHHFTVDSPAREPLSSFQARWVALGENHACGSYRGVFLSVPGSRDLEIIRSWIKRHTATQHFLSPFQTMFLMGPLGAHACVRACVCGHKASPSTKGAQSFSSLRFCIYKVNS